MNYGAEVTKVSLHRNEMCYGKIMMMSKTNSDGRELQEHRQKGKIT